MWKSTAWNCPWPPTLTVRVLCKRLSLPLAPLAFPMPLPLVSRLPSASSALDSMSLVLYCLHTSPLPFSSFTHAPTKTERTLSASQDGQPSFNFLRRHQAQEGGKEGEEELLVTVHITCNNEPLHGVPLSTSSPSTYDPQRHCVYWQDALLTFPGVKYRDLSLDARLVFTVWGLGSVPVAMTAVGFFGPYGVLRMGKQKLCMHFTGVTATTAATTTAAEEKKDSAAEYLEGFAKQDVGFRLEKAREGYIFNQPQLPPVEWLDRVTLPYTARVLAELAQNPCHPQEWVLEDEKDGEEDEEGREEGEEGASQPRRPRQRRRRLHQEGFLVVTLPMFQHPVLFEEKPYPGVVGVPFSGGLTLAPTATAAAPVPPSPTSRWTGSSDTGAGADEDGLSTAKVLNNMPGWELCAIYDCEAESDNPIEGKYRRLAHDKFRGGAAGTGGGIDVNLKPNKEERERIEALLASPSDHLRIEEKDLLWTFRHSLTDNRKALTKFLLSVDWSLEQEVGQVPALLEQWKMKTSVELSDALKLLGREKGFQHEIVRTFAVDTLRRATDDELLTYLLQLVQALRYEDRSEVGGGGGGGGGADSVASLSSEDLDAAAAGRGGGGEVGDGSMNGSGTRSLALARFLIGRACSSLELANFLYWYLRVEISEEEESAAAGGAGGDVFKSVFDDFGMTLREVNPVILDLLKKQDVYFTKIANAQRVAKNENGRRKDLKEEKLRNLLADADMNGLPKGAPYVPMPLDPHVQVAGVAASSAFMFKSALYPAVIQFRLYDQQRQQQQSSLDRSMASVSSSFVVTPRAHSPSACYKVIFKNGDDLRQDQLIIQMVTLMDFLLKRVNLDLKLTPYRILATGPRDGMIEFVSNSSPISEVLTKHGSIQEYFRAHSPEPDAPFGVRPDVLATFIKSLAGYCVITYLLGIGDRHLDNIMLLPQGNLLHIDFGFIFGQDPKPMPPPFRLAPSMVEAMGGEGHENFLRFKRYCCQAYNCFRGHANLILTLLGLMVDAGIKDLAADPVMVLGKVEEKFRLDLNVEQAELFFLSLVNDSMNALLPEILERVHKFALMRR